MLCDSRSVYKFVAIYFWMDYVYKKICLGFCDPKRSRPDEACEVCRLTFKRSNLSVQFYMLFGV